ncbi:unnamed protein product [Rotaria socialis]|uniref:Uncharacterized protein n=1 Tax=Rotaria socialis TaxID=392032 RepID=A0A820JVU8_9BILA|nr:unnamed protein product [Rotaria socialis]CAF3428305.1 unnamed protein product [Rotaria socialis]CAF4299368.1 unnamed protein product [Rotaria socialis]CAF4333799.1 unnamed protein product [Rotaria socialis]
MHFLFLLTISCLLFLPFACQFLTGSASTLLTYTGRNLTCSNQVDTLYNGSATYQSNPGQLGAYYCIMAVSNTLVNNLTSTSISRGAIYTWNLYRNIAVHHCGFSTTMDIGYGNCTLYPFETATSMQLCVCSTNNCTATYSTCQASVNQALASPPPLIPVLQPTLSNTITCLDYYVNYSAVYNIIPPVYLGCAYIIASGAPNMSACYSYTPNHTLICSVFYDPISGNFQQAAMIEGDYELWMENMIINAAVISSNSSIGNLYQTSTSIAVIMFGSSVQSNGAFCLCTTNNCNVNFSTCTNGMNIPSYIWAINGSTSVTSTAPTTNASRATTISSGSTTVLTTSTPRATTISSGSTAVLTTSTPRATTISSGSTIVPTTAILTISTPMSRTTSAKSSTATSAQFQYPFMRLFLQITVYLLARLCLNL